MKIAIAVALTLIVTMFVRWGIPVLACDENGFFSLDDVKRKVPQFEENRVSVQPIKKPVPVVLKGNPEARLYRSVLREGAAKGPNFAGRYTIVQWGCGAGCVDWAIVDAITGKAFFIDNARDVSVARVTPLPLVFRLGSNLLVLLGAPKEDETRNGITYYLWNGKSLRQLDHIPASDLCRAGR